MAVVAACVVPPPPSPGGCCRPIFPNSFSERHQGFSFQPDENAAGENTEKEPAPPEPPEEDGKRHGFLILSREDSTMVRPPAGDGIVVRGAHWGAVAAKGPAARCCAARDGCHRLPVAPCRLLHWLWCLVSPRGCRVRPPPPQILQTGQEIMELDTSGFATQGPTVFAGNIGENRYIVQVSPLGIRLLEGGGCWPRWGAPVGAAGPTPPPLFPPPLFPSPLPLPGRSEPAALHPGGFGLADRPLRRRRPLRGDHERRGAGHHVRPEKRHVRGPDPPPHPPKTPAPPRECR